MISRIGISRIGISRIGLLVCLVTLLSSGSLEVAASNRVALVIGNSQYENASALPNPVNDARAMAKKFESLGFKTVQGYDLKFVGLREKIREFARQAQGADLATFFYAGHGIAVDGRNYIVPVDAALDDAIDWEFQVYALDRILGTLRHSKGANLIFLDACRDNPLAEVLARSMGKSTRSIGGRGLTRVEADPNGAGMAVAFATSPGEVAEDGVGEHSPFTAALLKHIGAANTDIAEIMGRVTGEVYASTSQRQRPWLNSSLTGPVMLNKVKVADTKPSPANPASAKPEQLSSLETQKFMIQLAKDSGDKADYQSYLDVYPDGLFASIARNAIVRIDAAQQPASEALVDNKAKSEPLTQQGAKAVVAAVQAQQADAVITRTLATPLALSVTPVVAALAASTSTETELFLSKAQRRAIQQRLNLAGHNAGGADGSFGKRTRRALRSWQAQQGLPATGYLNNVQLQLLTVNTEAAYLARAKAVQPSKRARRAERPKRATSRAPSRATNRAPSRAPNRASQARREPPTQGPNLFERTVGGFLEGVGKGIGESLVK